MLNRRDFLAVSAAVAAFSRTGSAAAAPDFRMPGPFPGRVVETVHPGSMSGGKPDLEAVRAMMRKGIAELTGAPDWVAGWRSLFHRGDVVGIKVNPVGFPHAPTNFEVVLEIVAGLEAAGVRRRDIVVFDRYRNEFERAGYPKIVPDGVRAAAVAPAYDNIQLAIDGYDRDVFVELPLVRPDVDPKDPRARRSHVCRIVSREINKLINVPVLKDHQSAGVTLALKNMSHGLVNNVSRSHSTGSLNACGTFIPSVCSLPIIRKKAVLHVLDGLRGVAESGPQVRDPKYVWEQKTLWFATDPVAMDRIGWEIIDNRRREIGLQREADTAPMQGGSFVHRQVEHIEIAGALGLGIYDRKKIDLRRSVLG